MTLDTFSRDMKLMHSMRTGAAPWIHFSKCRTPLHGHRLRTPATNTTNGHHQRTSSQQFYDKFTTNGQKFATSQHPDMSRCWALALRCGKFVVELLWAHPLVVFVLAGFRSRCPCSGVWPLSDRLAAVPKTNRDCEELAWCGAAQCCYTVSFISESSSVLSHLFVPFYPFHYSLTLCSRSTQHNDITYTKNWQITSLVYRTYSQTSIS